MAGTLKTFNRNEVFEIISKRDWARLKEYDLTGAYLRYADFHEADLRGVDLYGTDLHGADLRGADLRGASLYFAVLFEADLRGADLQEADLRGTYLQRTNLQGANMQGSNLWMANLCGSNSQGINLREADLGNSIVKWANLQGADLRGADLWGADFCGSNLDDVITDETTKFFAMQCPETGTFVGYKKVYDRKQNPYIAELQISEHALRSSATTYACRCSEAKVLSITTLDGKNVKAKRMRSQYAPRFIYKLGKTVKVDDFDRDRWEECAPGIHFFMEREKAVRFR